MKDPSYSGVRQTPCRRKEETPANQQAHLSDKQIEAQSQTNLGSDEVDVGFLLPFHQLSIPIKLVCRQQRHPTLRVGKAPVRGAPLSHFRLYARPSIRQAFKIYVK